METALEGLEILLVRLGGEIDAVDHAMGIQANGDKLRRLRRRRIALGVAYKMALDNLCFQLFYS